MMMSPDEIQGLNETNAKVATEARRNNLTERIARLDDHIRRLGPSPEFQRAIDDAKAELAELGQGAA